MTKGRTTWVPRELAARVSRAAAAEGVSEEVWVRRALERALAEQPNLAPLERLGSLCAPTGDIEDMLAEIAAGRRPR